ncbi:SHOCT domain-containing protein [Bdellovibrio bacteriovorus]|uniref:SHOCT domain-containing protein n=1 Tax=Bdellovibrio bacteriovorus TaxID=959 RepID=UPI003AA81C40
MNNNQIETILQLIGLSALMWMIISFYCMFSPQIQVEKKVRKMKASGELKPIRFLPLANIREISHSDFVSYFIYANLVQDAVNKGNTNYSSLEVTRMFNSLKFYASIAYFTKKHRILAIYLALLTIPVGFIPLILFSLAMGVHFKLASKAEVAVNEYVNGTLIRHTSGASTSIVGVSDELKKLVELRQSGALSDQEFSILKEKLIKVG